jgi:hypothetical protein
MVGGERNTKRAWWAFRVGKWVLVVIGVALLILGQSWPGLIALLSSAVVRIAWGDWSKREQARLGTGVHEAQH